MLDGLLGRGFSAKCKSYIKVTKTRIDAIRRKRNAMQKFLKKDIADLLANGLDINAYGRAEGLLVELNLSSCYDFIEQFCGCIQQQLSSMRKQRECPEECKEAVPSLMFAAARFADLPELRDLRHMFTGRYGSSLECFVNQEFVEKFAAKPPTKEKKLQLMRDIAQEFSIKWDGKAFEQKMSNHSASVQDGLKKHASFHDINDHGHKFSDGNDVIQEGDEQVMPSRRRHKSYGGNKFHNGKVGTGPERSEPHMESHGGQELADDDCKPPKLKESTLLKRDNQDISSHGRHDLDDDVYRQHGRREYTVPTKEEQDTFSHGKPTLKLGCITKQQTQIDNDMAPNVNHPNDQHRSPKSIEKISLEEERTKSYQSKFVPPPYVKSKFGKYGTNSEARHSSWDIKEPPMSPMHNQDIYNDISERAQAQVDSVNYEDGGVGRERVNVRGKDHNKEDDLVTDVKPKPRSVRRRQLKPQLTQTNINDLEGDAVVKRSSSGRKQEDDRRNKQASFDHDVGAKDEEDNMMDRLLLHYSRKPSTYEPGKVRTGSKAHSEHREAPPTHRDAGEGSESPHYKIRDKMHLHSELGPIRELGPSGRAISLPPEPATPKETGGPVRAASFQPEILHPAGHVHPKLPDYDDLAARILALKGK